MAEANATISEIVPGTSKLTNAELDEKLEEQILRNNDSEKHICIYLAAIRERGAYRDFGFSNIYDYAYERFGFSDRKTRYLVSLGRKLDELPKLRHAVKTGKLGWCKASRVASVANKEDEAMWLESALSLSVRDLERRIRDGTDNLASTLHFWMTEDQRVVWENALEICRRVAGSELSPGQALEYIAGDFIATYAHLLRDEPAGDQSQPGEKTEDRPQVAGESVRGAKTNEHSPLQPLLDPAWEMRICPIEDGVLPSPETSIPYNETWCRVLERDGWTCQYPGCSARSGLHVHHIEYRSHAGKKSWARNNAPSNLVVLCAFHHRMVHAKLIDVKGRAPHELDWRPPKLMAEVLERRRNRPSLHVGDLDLRFWPPSRTA